jgi:hypothetical protein
MPNKYPYFLFPIETKGMRHPPPFIAFDTENDPSSGDFISGAIYGKYIDSNKHIHPTEGYYEDRFDLQQKLLDIAEKRPGRNAFRLVGHNVDYDLKYINEIVDDSTRLSAGSRLITARLKMGSTKGIKIYDSSNFVRGSLESWIKDLDMKKNYGVVKLPLTQLKERNIMDAKATYHLITWIEDFMNKNLDIPLQLTLGASSLYFFKKKHLKYPLIRYNGFHNQYERKAYRGGRVEAFRRGIQRVKSYDVHKMYLSIMKDEVVPLPQSARYVKNDIGFKDVYKDNKTLFIAHARVEVPDQYIAPLPYYSDELRKLIFPVGTFEGYFTSVELRDAVENYGVIIKKVFNYMYYKESIPLFHDFAKHVYETQEKYASLGLSNFIYMIKTIGNSLYGKLGEKHGGGVWVKIIDFTDSIEGLNMKTLHDGEEYGYIRGGVATDSTHTFPGIPAFITGYGRVKLLHRMKEHEYYIIYCDTDSTHFDACVDLPDEKGIGNWGFEYERTQMYYRPKMYGSKIKGVPKRAELVGSGVDKKYFSFEKPLKRAESIRRHDVQNRWIRQLKTVSIHDDKRTWDGVVSEPIRVEI